MSASVVPHPRVADLRLVEARGHLVVLDADLATLYAVETKAFNQAIKRNRERFPDDFAFQLAADEWAALRSQFVTLELYAQIKPLLLPPPQKPRPSIGFCPDPDRTGGAPS